MTEAGAPQHLRDFLAEHAVEHEIVAPGVPMPTVTAAAAAIGVSESQILKTLLFADGAGGHVVAIANGVSKVDRTRLAALAGAPKLQVAAAADVLRVTGYPAGGVSPLGLPPGIPVIVDRAVLALPVAFGGAGREELLLRVAPADVVRLNAATVGDIIRADSQ